MIDAQITITLKKGVLDPQGQAILSALSSLGFQNMTKLTQGKVFHISLNETDQDKAQQTLTQMCEKLLANTVIENYKIDFSTPSDK